MAERVKANRTPSRPAGRRTPDSGRAAQRRRTRKAIVDAAMQLMEAGRTPTIPEIADAAQVCRRTIYMYFPRLEHLLLDATLGALSAATVDPVVRAPAADDDPAARLEHVSRAVNRVSGSTMHLGRALIRLTIDGDGRQAAGPRRGYRRVEWIETALEPLRRDLDPGVFERLVSALSVLMGWEALVVLRDVRGLEQTAAEDVLAWAARSLVECSVSRGQGAERRDPLTRPASSATGSAASRPPS